MIDRMSYIEFGDYHNLLYRIDYIDGLDCYEEIESKESGIVVARFYDDGYESLDCFVMSGIVRGMNLNSRFSTAYKTAINVAHLNPNKGFSVLQEYIDKMCDDLFDTDKFKMNREILYEAIKNTLDGKTEFITKTHKYYFTTPLPLSEKRKIVATHNAKTKKMNNFKLVESAINMLMETDVFITSTEISKEIEMMYGKEKALSVRVIKNTLNNDLRADMDSHNKKIHKTDNFKIYEKFCHVNNIVSAIEAIRMMNDKLTKTKIADIATVHRNTVNNLWEEKKIQDVLNKYNLVVR